MPNQPSEHHLVTVWNPSYAADAMEQHLGLLLHFAGEYGKRAIGEDGARIRRSEVLRSDTAEKAGCYGRVVTGLLSAKRDINWRRLPSYSTWSCAK